MKKPLIILLALKLTACLQVPSLEQQRSPLTQSEAAKTQGLLVIHLPYVGQGDATLIQLPSGKNLLIDTTNPQAALENLMPYLESFKIQSLDAVLLTHYDLDHVGGLETLVKNGIEIKTLYDRGAETYNESTYSQYLSQALASDLNPIALKAGDKIELDNQVKIHVLAASGQVLNEAGGLSSLDLSPETYSSQENASSIVLLIEYGEFRYLTGGDLTGGSDLGGFLSPDVESLVANALERPVDALHANHHGSLSSSNENFIEASHPEAVFIQAGVANFYSHPHPSVINDWLSIGAEVYSTHEGAGYLLTSDGSGFNVEVFEE